LAKSLDCLRGSETPHPTPRKRIWQATTLDQISAGRLGVLFNGLSGRRDSGRSPQGDQTFPSQSAFSVVRHRSVDRIKGITGHLTPPQKRKSPAPRVSIGPGQAFSVKKMKRNRSTYTRRRAKNQFSSVWRYRGLVAIEPVLPASLWRRLWIKCLHPGGKTWR
jgi:hypothetical protein